MGKGYSKSERTGAVILLLVALLIGVGGWLLRPASVAPAPDGKVTVFAADSLSLDHKRAKPNKNRGAKDSGKKKARKDSVSRGEKVARKTGGVKRNAAPAPISRSPRDEIIPSSRSDAGSAKE